MLKPNKFPCFNGIHHNLINWILIKAKLMKTLFRNILDFFCVDCITRSINTHVIFPEVRTPLLISSVNFFGKVKEAIVTPHFFFSKVVSFITIS